MMKTDRTVLEPQQERKPAFRKSKMDQDAYDFLATAWMDGADDLLLDFPPCQSRCQGAEDAVKR